MAKSAISMKLPDDIELPSIKPKGIKRRFNPRTPIGERSDIWINVVHEVDPAKVLMDRIGPIPEGVVQWAHILVAIYTPPAADKTDGGVFIGTKIQKEDINEYLWQGKVGLIVAMGERAYKDDERIKWHGLENKVGDWVWFQPSHGVGCDVNQVFCRVFKEADILGKLPHPDYVI